MKYEQLQETKEAEIYADYGLLLIEKFDVKLFKIKRRKNTYY